MSLSLRIAVVPDHRSTAVEDVLARLPEVLPDGVAVNVHRLDPSTDSDLTGFDAVLLGSVEPAVLQRLRGSMPLRAEVRPLRRLPGVATPLRGDPPLDLVLMSESVEGVCADLGGRCGTGAGEVGTQLAMNTAAAIERVVREAYRWAQRRPRRLLTLVHKRNILVHTGDLWMRVFERIGREFPGVRREYLHVDAATMFLVTDPGRFDVVVTDRLFAGIMAAVAAAAAGDTRAAPTAELSLADGHPSLFYAATTGAPSAGAAAAGAAAAHAAPLALEQAARTVALLLEQAGLASQQAGVASQQAGLASAAAKLIGAVTGPPPVDAAMAGH